jgi:CRISPR-associated protein Cas2
MANKLYQPILVCYDIEDNKVRKKFADTLKDMGLTSLQKSVFWGQLNKAELRSLKREADRLLNAKTDKAFWVKASLNAQNLAECIGYQDIRLLEPDGYEIL